MGSLLPDARVPRRIAAGYGVLALAVLIAAAGAGLHLDRRERDRISGEAGRAAGEPSQPRGRLAHPAHELGVVAVAPLFPLVSSYAS